MLLAALLAMSLAAEPVRQGQVTYVRPTMSLPEFPGGRRDPTCVDTPQIVLEAICILTTRGDVTPLIGQYTDYLKVDGWALVDRPAGATNVVYRRPNPGGRCDYLVISAAWKPDAEGAAPRADSPGLIMIRQIVGGASCTATYD